MTTHKLLVYGILTKRATLENVIKRPWSGEYEDALVPDWTRYHKNRGSLWYAAPAPGQVLEAVLIDGLTDEDLGHLDILEGTSHHHYDRVRVSYLGDQTEGEAWIYRDGQYRPAPTAEEITARAHRRIRQQADRNADRPAQMAGYQSLEDMAESMGILSAPPLKAMRFTQIATTGSEPAGRPPVITGGHGEPKKRRRAPESRMPAPEPPVSPGVSLEPHRDLPLFAYGALTFREVLEERIGHVWAGEYRPATLPGWKIEAGWPRHAVPTPKGRAFGFLLPLLTEQDLRVIDKYEGVHNDVYRRVIVELEDGSEAYFYSTGEAGHRRLARRAAGTEPMRRPFISGQRVTA
jgi:gamma-glutamylcyclotransferase (GGCT)/AIG2-like uncharacterized protein YtfP